MDRNSPGSTLCISSRLATLALGAVAGVVLTFVASTGWAQPYAPVICNQQQRQPLPTQTSAANPQDLLVTGTCDVPLNHTYYFRNVNIVRGGGLVFTEPRSAPNSRTDFWAASIIVENQGLLAANAWEPGQQAQPFGYHGGTLTFHLYGQNDARWDPQTNKFLAQNQGALCRSTHTGSPCGVETAMWGDNGATLYNMPSMPDAKKDYFYQYGPLRGDARCDDGTIWTNGRCGAGGNVGYFGNKVIAVSYGGALSLHGYKGAAYTHYSTNFPLDDNLDPASSGSSWIRLQDGKSLEAGADKLWLETAPATWAVGDEIVVTTTDYLPSHSERLKITKIDGAYIEFEALDSETKKIRWPHNGVRYGGPADEPGKRWTTRLPERVRTGISSDLLNNGAETRAAVALLTRSIRIVSEGNAAGRSFDAEGPNYIYGGHLVVRQGATTAFVKGVEFQRMGQGGRLGHYPIHFHMARHNYYSYVKDSTINESMTRWIVLHATQGVTLARNVGYKSIGHGFYFEDGTETDNRLYSNIGILARAAIQSPGNSPNNLNSRNVPGILSYNGTDGPSFPNRSDNEYPTVFWITNGWNDFIGNMAAGAGACGAAYWLVPTLNMNMRDVPGNTGPGMKWFGYAGLQQDSHHAGTTPLKSFYKNYATSTMHSFQTTPDAPVCHGFAAATAAPGDLPIAKAVNSLAPSPSADSHYYPQAVGARKSTHCPLVNGEYQCTDGQGKVSVDPCGAGNLKACAVTVLDHFTTSFHWAEGNISAIWLRPQWYVMTNSVVTDVQNGGLTMVSGGDYTHSSVIPGYYGLVRNSIFVGNTRDNAKYPFARNTGPFNDASQVKCIGLQPQKPEPNYCLNVEEVISMPVNGWFTNQRFLNVYDGPFYQDSNTFLDITPADCPVGRYNGDCMYGRQASFLLLRKTPGSTDPAQCYIPNAAIGWKQPNGFFYPPAFLSRNLFFDNVALRHFVIDPLVGNGTYLTATDQVKAQYCSITTNIFNNFSANDRQTTLTDEDGTLTGLVNSLGTSPLNSTYSINEDPFFRAPVETAECGSAVGDNASASTACAAPQPAKPPATAKTSPFDHLKVVVYRKDPSPVWQSDCANEGCYGVPLFRQFLTKDEWSTWSTSCNTQPQRCRWPFIRMAGFNFGQRESLVINNGLYYVDTTVSLETQQQEAFYDAQQPRQLNVFEPGKTYYMFFVYAKESTVQTFQIYVGSSFLASSVQPQKVDISTSDLRFSPAPGEIWLKKVDFDQARGILTVTVDFTGFGKLAPTAENGLCKPEMFCRPDGSSCGSALTRNDSRVAVNPGFLAESDAICRNWAMKSLDCPEDGCRGFSLTLPNDFKTGTYRRPDPQPFPIASGGPRPQGAPDWSTRLRRATLPPDATSGRCHYTQVPGTDCLPP
jgi:hypothetical protein